MPPVQADGAHVVAVCQAPRHEFSKRVVDSVQIVEGHGVLGDAHAGPTVKHRSRVRQDPTQPNLRQVHLIHHELIDELRRDGFDLNPGDLGENLTTRGIALLDLPTGSLLRIGETLLEVTGLRNPCAQIEAFRPGMLSKLCYRDADGRTVRRSGVMAVVREGGTVRAGTAVEVELPPGPHRPLERV